ncbi:MAG: sarcosine oxidase subunit gamma [Confluentimicrobium sp.]|uniref:sarcosine oxidase subunit gamma n=1 Tax=Actibacterium sp. TaxID=1872125 RepID=UPI000C517E90|nr:sarcosine oxidase subunit gamma family protein [Actibacterium sp.]MBC57956.1 sarcosine oxidase subunit gamma [Actibacterium sp.]|tara:strand:- start:762 stop:1340 length:579 start_codon:yes stop_codon:yes gene_type:complete
MSDPVSALNGAAYDGVVRVEELGLRGMITLRGDHASVAVKNAATGVAGVDFPDALACDTVGERGLAWMSPDELLVLVPYAEADRAVAAMQTELAGTHSLVVNVSDARAMFRISGPAAREVLAKLCPVDLSPGAFGPGDFRRTRAAQVPVAFWMQAEDAFALICFRSVAGYVFDLLKTAARPGGEVGYFPAGA